MWNRINRESEFVCAGTTRGPWKRDWDCAGWWEPCEGKQLLMSIVRLTSCGFFCLAWCFICASFTISRIMILSNSVISITELVEISIIVLCGGSGKDFVIWSTSRGTEFYVVLKKSLCNSCNLFPCMHYIIHSYNSDISYVWIAWKYADCNSMFICNKIFCAWRLHIKLLKLDINPQTQAN